MLQKNGYYKDLDEYLCEPNVPWWLMLVDIVCFSLVYYVVQGLGTRMAMLQCLMFAGADIFLINYFVLKSWDSGCKEIETYIDAVKQGSRRYYALYKLKRKYDIDFNEMPLIQRVHCDLGVIHTFVIFNYLRYLRKLLSEGLTYQRFLDFDKKYREYKKAICDIPDYTDEESFNKRFPGTKLKYKLFREYEELLCDYYAFDVEHNFQCSVKLTYSLRFFKIVETQYFDYDTIIDLCKMVAENRNFTSARYRTIFKLNEHTRFIIKSA